MTAPSLARAGCCYEPRSFANLTALALAWRPAFADH